MESEEVSLQDEIDIMLNVKEENVFISAHLRPMVVDLWGDSEPS